MRIVSRVPIFHRRGLFLAVSLPVLAVAALAMPLLLVGACLEAHPSVERCWQSDISLLYAGRGHDLFIAAFNLSAFCGLLGILLRCGQLELIAPSLPLVFALLNWFFALAGITGTGAFEV